MAKKKTINLTGTDIRLLAQREDDFISLTDIAKKIGEPRILVQNWMRTRNNLEFLGIWEVMNNPDFKRIEFDAFLYQAGGRYNS